MLFLDDREDSIAAARALGIRAHLHRDDAVTLRVIREAVGTRDTLGGAL